MCLFVFNVLSYVYSTILNYPSFIVASDIKIHNIQFIHTYNITGRSFTNIVFFLLCAFPLVFTQFNKLG